MSIPAQYFQNPLGIFFIFRLAEYMVINNNNSIGSYNNTAADDGLSFFHFFKRYSFNCVRRFFSVPELFIIMNIDRFKPDVKLLQESSSSW